MIKGICLTLLAVALLGCGANDNGKRYTMQGDVKAVDAAAKTATIAAGKVGNWMDAMTMEYPVRPGAELAKLHVGDHIEAAVVVQGETYYLTDIKIVPKP